MRRIHLIILTGILICISVYLTYRTFFASYGPVLVDYVAFTAGIVLLFDGFLALRKPHGKK